MKKKTASIIGIFFVLALFLFAIKNFLPKEKSGLKELFSPPKPTGPVWEQYQNSKYGYELSYASGWKIEEWDIQEAANLKRVPDGMIWHQAEFSGEEGDFEVLIWENRSQIPVRTWLNWFRHEDLILKEVPQEENFTVAELPAIRFIQKETAKDKPLLYIFFGQENKVYELVMVREDLAEVATPSGRLLSHPVYDQMINSFKFLVE